MQSNISIITLTILCPQNYINTLNSTFTISWWARENVILTKRRESQTAEGIFSPQWEKKKTGCPKGLISASALLVWDFTMFQMFHYDVT